MFDENIQPKPHHQNFFKLLQHSNEDELREKHVTARLSFLKQGITFTVYDYNIGTERTMPFDFVPIIIPSEEWETAEKGMSQRAEALNLFLEDVYGEQRILEAGIVPRKLVEDNPYYYAEQVIGIEIPLKNQVKGVYRGGSQSLDVKVSVSLLDQ